LQFITKTVNNYCINYVRICYISWCFNPGEVCVYLTFILFTMLSANTSDMHWGGAGHSRCSKWTGLGSDPCVDRCSENHSTVKRVSHPSQVHHPAGRCMCCQVCSLLCS